MHYSEIKLPKTEDELIQFYLYLSMRLREIWEEYVSYAEATIGPTDSGIFMILFCEMDFFESLRQRVVEKLSPELIVRLRGTHDYSGW